MMSWESDSPIVPTTSGNTERGKGATYYRSY